MKAESITFEKLQRDKREARAEDARRLQMRVVTPVQLEVENSLIPMETKVSVLRFSETVERYYGR